MVAMNRKRAAPYHRHFAKYHHGEHCSRQTAVYHWGWNPNITTREKTRGTDPVGDLHRLYHDTNNRNLIECHTVVRARGDQQRVGRGLRG